MQTFSCIFMPTYEDLPRLSILFKSLRQTQGVDFGLTLKPQGIEESRHVAYHVYFAHNGHVAAKLPTALPPPLAKGPF